MNEKFCLTNCELTTGYGFFSQCVFFSVARSLSSFFMPIFIDWEIWALYLFPREQSLVRFLQKIETHVVVRCCVLNDNFWFCCTYMCDSFLVFHFHRRLFPYPFLILSHSFMDYIENWFFECCMFTAVRSGSSKIPLSSCLVREKTL